MAETFKIAIGNFEAEYRLYRTTAPLNADGFGTIALTPDEPKPNEERWVLIRTEHENWQVSRYHSGLWAPAFEEMDDSLAAWVRDALYKRLMGPGSDR